MALHPLATGFDGVAGAYERGRPEYAPAVVGAIAAELTIPAGAPVLDLAAGTGKLTRALLAGGFDAVAVEPQEQMREALARAVGAERVHAGVAEAIPLPDAAVAAVTVGDGFHWFDQPAALAEIRRVLRPGGGLALLRSAPDWSAASWVGEVGGLIAGARTEHPGFDGPPWQDAVRADGGWSAPRELRLTSTQPATPERVVDYIASISWIAALPPAEQRELLARATQLVHAGETPDELPVHVTIGLASLV